MSIFEILHLLEIFDPEQFEEIIFAAITAKRKIAMLLFIVC